MLCFFEILLRYVCSCMFETETMLSPHVEACNTLCIHVYVFITVMLDFRYFLCVFSIQAHAHNVCVGIQPLFLCVFFKNHPGLLSELCDKSDTNDRVKMCVI